MLPLEAAGSSVQAATTVGTVFAEALALYVGYGALTRVFSSTVMDAVGGE